MRLTILLAMVAVGGCGGDARVDLSAADGIRAAARQMELTLHEYHDEVARYDTSREDAVIGAFVSRVKTDGQNDAALTGHVADFRATLDKIRKDRDTEYQRQAAAADNVAVLREMSRGLERLGIESLTLQDEMKRYLTSWLDARRRADASAATTAGHVAANTDSTGGAK
jgi:hypothetical protein